MVTINTILEEMKDIPVEHLSEVYQFVHSFNVHHQYSDSKRREIMSCAGMLSDMSEEDYADFLGETKRIRQGRLERNLEF
jgi:hypothetical protein